MTRRILFLLLFLITSLQAYSQKKLVDTTDFGKWAYVSDPGISNDGKYISFTINDQPYPSSIMVIKKTSTNWEKRIPNGTSVKFSDDSRSAILKVKDTLQIVNLEHGQTQSIPGVESFGLVKFKKAEWLIYHPGNIAVGLILKNLKTGQQLTLDSATDYQPCPDGKSLLVTQNYKDKIGEQELVIYDPELKISKSLWHGPNPYFIIFDNLGDKIAFYTGSSLECYKLATLYIVDLNTGEDMKVTLQDLGKSEDMTFNANFYDHYRFSNDGKRLFFSVSDQDGPIKPGNGVKVTIWNYQDAKLQSCQSDPTLAKQEYLYCFTIKQNKWIALTNEFESIPYNCRFSRNRKDDYIVVERIEGNASEFYWNPKSKQKVTLVSTLTGERKVIKEESKDYLKEIEISPNGNYLVYYNCANRNYESYDVQTGIVRNLTSSIHTNWGNINGIPSMQSPLGILGWMQDSRKILLKDFKGVWEIDLERQMPPVNFITPNYSNRIFTILRSNGNNIYQYGDILIFQGYNLENKSCGFYKLELSSGKKMQFLSEGPYQYQKNYSYYSTLGPNELMKAKYSEDYLLTRQSASTAPNFFLTTDFKKFKQVSKVYPEKGYNWITSELHQYIDDKGERQEGVLLKPQNFDPQKKYPVIFIYYTESTDNLNKYYYPEANGGYINFPWYISNDYLIFMPDIKFDSVSTSGESAYHSVTAAVNYLTKKPWVNQNKIAAHGGSFGGFETNYILTKTGVFTAAMELAGMTNLVAMYGSIFTPYGNSQTVGYDIGMLRMWGTLWDKQQNYLDNSAILHANKITTPLLIMHNPKDGSVPYEQGLSFFIALRRLQKKVWMLEYENQNHIIYPSNRIARMDYQIRVKQFFDHYLKDRAMPKWMSVGVPAKFRGVDNGLKLEE
ncbi:S9 family peptidase [Chitinophaga sp. Ak27]|uniref:S9 family peptidase n=1 Tax=Chitinophaga sp. Ak27 TaxID=2726116 RepID=UPI00145EEC78|nr:prolyl oligopeptidase family serine peptidase [Chitinophaga sp. Ak27]NLU94873.1 S9 family peptidase [Chitinophaga sp. Ak27]